MIEALIEALLDKLPMMPQNLKTVVGKLALLAPLLLGLPLAGVWVRGMPLAPYFAFPPQTAVVEHSAFSWPVFFAYCCFLFACLFPIVQRCRKAAPAVQTGKAAPLLSPFPVWGWAGLVLAAGAWVLAWTRFAWFAPFQPFSFTPLWIGYILVVNALCLRRMGTCLMTERTGTFLLLFPLSALFWWFFEYLNRFVHNWYYTGATFTAWEYFLYATLPFSTVLPAVVSTRRWLESFPFFSARFAHLFVLNPGRPKAAAAAVLAVACLGLAGIGVWPHLLFPLLWIAPLLILTCVQALGGERHIFSPLSRGDWRLIVVSALSALVCGLFWEMWNYGSLAGWAYQIPHVDRFHVFEMPLLGWAGYLPFGLECTVVAALLDPETLQYRARMVSARRSADAAHPPTP